MRLTLGSIGTIELPKCPVSRRREKRAAEGDYRLPSPTISSSRIALVVGVTPLRIL